MADLSFCGFTFPSRTSPKYLTPRKHWLMHRNGQYSDLHESNTAWWLGVPQFLRQRLHMTETLLIGLLSSEENLLSYISEASGFTDFQSSLQWLHIYESRENTQSHHLSPLYTHTHTHTHTLSLNKPSQIISSATQSPLVAHHPMIHKMTSSTLHSILKFSCLLWRRWPGAGGEAVDHLNQSSVARNYFFFFLWNILPAKVWRI